MSARFGQNWSGFGRIRIGFDETKASHDRVWSGVSTNFWTVKTKSVPVSTVRGPGLINFVLGSTGLGQISANFGFARPNLDGVDRNIVSSTNLTGVGVSTQFGLHSAGCGPGSANDGLDFKATSGLARQTLERFRRRPTWGRVDRSVRLFAPSPPEGQKLPGLGGKQRGPFATQKQTCPTTRWQVTPSGQRAPACSRVPELWGGVRKSTKLGPSGPRRREVAVARSASAPHADGNTFRPTRMPFRSLGPKHRFPRRCSQAAPCSGLLGVGPDFRASRMCGAGKAWTCHSEARLSARHAAGAELSPPTAAPGKPLPRASEPPMFERCCATTQARRNVGPCAASPIWVEGRGVGELLAAECRRFGPFVG